MPMNEAEWYGECSGVIAVLLRRQMHWLDQTLDQLAQQPAIGYAPGGKIAAEPTAIAALALHVHGRAEAAREAARALVTLQASDGEIGVRAGEPTPGWPTS